VSDKAVRELLAKWRVVSKMPDSQLDPRFMLSDCADELEAALAVPEEPKP
jgi:hypothetical protein